MSRKPQVPRSRGGDQKLVVWGERGADPGWDRDLAALIAMALRLADDEEQRPHRTEVDGR